PGFTAPTFLEPAVANAREHAADFDAAGEALLAVEGKLGSGKGVIRIDLRRPGGPIKRQLLPAGGSTQVNESSDVAADLARNGRGVVAWTQGDAIFYSLRQPGGSFGPAHKATVPGVDTAGLTDVSVAVDIAGNVSFVWTTATGTFPNGVSRIRAVQRRASDGHFLSSQLIDQPGPNEGIFGASVHVAPGGHAVLTYALSFMGPPTGKYTFRDVALGTVGPVTDG